MNGRLDKVAMTNKLMKRELHYKCEIGEKGEWECANDYLNRVFDVDKCYNTVKFNFETIELIKTHGEGMLIMSRMSMRFISMSVVH